MALTITENFRHQLSGGLKLMGLSITHDETTSNFSAASVDMTRFVDIIGYTPKITSDVANTSVLLQQLTVSIVNGSKGVSNRIEWNIPHPGVSRLTIVGW